MAQMNPEYSDEQLNSIESQAEAITYSAFRDRLPDSWHVYHSITWIVRRENDEARDGEIDFVICHPDHGFLAIEVKGGGIGFDSQSSQWYSIDRFQRRHNISDPIAQAKRAKYSILGKLQEHPRWASLNIRRVTCGHVVLFPNLRESQKPTRPDLPAQLVGVESTLLAPEEWLITAFDYWKGEDGRQEPIKQSGVALFDSVFARSFEALPLIAQAIESEEAQRITLTQQQARILDHLRARRRVAISGGAGTGKTVIAVEKARRLAGEGFNTLLTCFNRPLADHLVSVCEGVDNLEVMSFHQLCVTRVREADTVSGRDLLQEARQTYPGQDKWNVLYPNALAYSTDIIEDSYDAIVCDEGQDFGEDYWVPIELLLSDGEKSPLYIFYDENQDLYSRAASFPINDASFPLTINCRNTQKIHNISYRYYHGEPIDPPPISGHEIESVCAETTDSQATRLHGRIVELIGHEGIDPTEIAVLVANAYLKSQYYEALRHKPLPRGVQWLEEGQIHPGCVLMETVNRFKGLEAPIVFLWGIDDLPPEENAEIFYVGLSRPKSMLYLVGKTNSCDGLLESGDLTEKAH